MDYKREDVLWFPNTGACTCKEPVQPGFDAATVVFTTDGYVLHASYNLARGRWEDLEGEVIEWDEIAYWAAITGPKA